jgi:hypothetical protein
MKSKCGGLPNNSHKIGETINVYKKVMSDIHGDPTSTL